jgi:predicted component of type VI protein secretion system
MPFASVVAMLVVLQATSNYARPQRIQIRANQVARIGRSEWADFSFSGDSAMSDLQFEIRSTAEICTILSLSHQPPTLVNGQEIQSATIHDGDQIDAGETRFLVHLEGERTTPRSRATSAAESATATQLPVGASAATAVSLIATCAYLEFGDDITVLATNSKTPDDLIDELAAQGKVQDALRLRAHLLSKRQAVWWGCLCVRDELDAPLPASQLAAIDAAEAWVSQPDEERRRASEKRAETAKFSGIGATLALSAFWSEGSIAPEGNPDVPPDERLTSQGVAAALISAAYHGDTAKATVRIDSFLAKGKDLASGKIHLPDGDDRR